MTARYGRRLAMLAVFSAVALGYFLTLRVFKVGTRPIEHSFPLFKVSAAHLPDAPPPGTSVTLTIPRAGASMLLAFAIYGATAAVACGALAIVVIVLAGWRSPESGLLSTLISMVFTQILLRNAVPGAPPLGVRGDVAVFLWAEIVCVLCLLTFIVIWLATGRCDRGRAGLWRRPTCHAASVANPTSAPHEPLKTFEKMVGAQFA